MERRQQFLKLCLGKKSNSSITTKDEVTYPDLPYCSCNNRLRFRLFRDNAAQVADFNDEVGETATFGVNFFSSMNSEEKQH